MSTLNNDCIRSTLLKTIFRSITLNRIVFGFIREINRNIRNNSKKNLKPLICNWYDLGCFPHLLIKYGYLTRYVEIYDSLIVNKIQFYIRVNNYFKRISKSFRNLLQSKESNHREDDDNHRLVYQECYSKSKTLNHFRMIYIKSLEYAASGGHLNIIRHLYKTESEIQPLPILKKAIKNNHFEIVEFVVNRNKDIIFRSVIDQVARLGNLKILEFFSSINAIGFDAETMNLAASKGHLDMVVYLHTHRSEGCTADAMNWAAYGGYIDVVKFLHFNRTEGCTSEAVNHASQNGNLDIVEFLLSHRSEGCTTYAMDKAAQNGHFQVVKYLHNNSTVGCTKEAMDKAAENNYMGIVQFLHDHRTEGARHAAAASAKNGNIEMVRWLHFNRTDCWGYRVMDAAISNGSFDIVEFLHNHRTEGCSDRALNGATGSLKDFQFLIENYSLSLKWDTLETAIFHKHLEVAKLIIDHYPSCYKPLDAMKQALNYKNFDVFKYLHLKFGNTVTLSTDIMNMLVTFKDVTVLQWMKENRSEDFSESVYVYAAKNGNLECMKWLHKNTKHECTRFALWRAIKNDDLQMVEYIHSLGVPFCNSLDHANSLPIIKFLHENRGSEGCTTLPMDQGIWNTNLDIIKFLSENRTEGSSRSIFKYENQRDWCIDFPSRLFLIKKYKL